MSTDCWVNIKKKTRVGKIGKLDLGEEVVKVCEISGRRSKLKSRNNVGPLKLQLCQNLLRGHRRSSNAPKSVSKSQALLDLPSGNFPMAIKNGDFPWLY